MANLRSDITSVLCLTQEETVLSHDIIWLTVHSMPFIAFSFVEHLIILRINFLDTKVIKKGVVG